MEITQQIKQEERYLEVERKIDSFPFLVVWVASGGPRPATDEAVVLDEERVLMDHRRDTYIY